MNEVINGLLLKLTVMSYAKWSTEEIFGKSKQDFEKLIEEMPTGEKVGLLDDYGTLVDEDFEDGGRWSNYRTRVYSFWHNSETIYVSVSDEVPATEIQDGGDFMEPEIAQVYPKKVETTIYITTKEAK
jgi:hypothetical protein